MLTYESYVQPYRQAVPLQFLWDAYSSWDTASCGDYELTLDHVSERLNEGYHFVFYYGHAGSEGWAMLQGRAFTWPRVAALTNPIPSIVVSEACSPAGFDRSETCVSEAFLRNPHGGAVAYFGHTRTTISPNASVQQWLLAMFRDRARTTGGAMSLAMAALASDRVSYPYEQYLFVLHGDPCIQLLREASGRHLQVFRPKGCEVIQQGSDLIIRWNAAGTGFEGNEIVVLDYSADSGATWHAITDAQNLRYNAGTFTWERCPLPVGSHYLIRVSSISDPAVSHMSEKDFRIAQLCFLTVQSVPDANVVITGSYDGVTTYDLTTNYDISVPEGTTVSLTAPWVSPEKPELTFVRWTDEQGHTLKDLPDYVFSVSNDITVIAEYGAPVVRHYYINDETPEDDFACGDDNNDGRSPDRPMRHIQALLNKYPSLGGTSVINASAGTYDEIVSLSAGNAGRELIGAGPGLTIVDGQQKGPCVSLDGFTEGVISGFTLRNGAGTYGGGIWCVNSSVTIRDCAFVENATAAAGAAIYVDTSSSADISDCAFSWNSGYNGGAIASFAAAEIRSCYFQANGAATFGGAIYAQSGGNVTRIVDCTFTGDASAGYAGNSSMFGGALYIFHGTATIDSCLFEANHADRDGGAVCADGNCEAAFINCIFNGNDTRGCGGAIATRQGQSHAIVTNCTFSGNTARYPGGGLCDRDNLGAAATNCIFWGNTPDQIDGGASVGYSDVQGDWPGEGNIDADPLFADPDAGDYHLKSQAGRWATGGRFSSSWVRDGVTSPCIDAGDPDNPVGEEPEPNGGRINMGAYGGTAEASKSPLGGPP
ncbi:MAG: right-handed parallel beta-helix repeat-containing protein [Sedimentisphaerales bacterium]|nr:right-handed parallel beta-helix repeat-containing protein [Sedimentisphaerales bacterium]